MPYLYYLEFNSLKSLQPSTIPNVIDGLFFLENFVMVDVPLRGSLSSQFIDSMSFYLEEFYLDTVEISGSIPENIGNLYLSIICFSDIIIFI